MVVAAATMMPPVMDASFGSTSGAAGFKSADMTSADFEASGMSASGGASNVQLAMQRAMQFFLQPDHYRKLNRILAERWKDCHSLTAAVRLMEAHGVPDTRDPQNPDGLPAWLAELDEARAIEALVAKMPQKSPEQFEHFFLQLSFIASTTQRIRSALENGQPELIEEAMESAENVGVLPYLLKMAVSQAGQEVLARCEEHSQWIGDCEAQLSPLLTISSEGMGVQKELAQSKAEMAERAHNSKSLRASVLSALADDAEIMLVGAVFHAFAETCKRQRREEQQRQEHKQQFDSAKKALTEFQQTQMLKVKRMIHIQRDERQAINMARVIAALKAEEAHTKEQQRIQAEGLIVSDAAKSFSTKAGKNARSALATFAGATEASCMAMVFGAFRVFLVESKKEKALVAAVDACHQKVAAFRDKQKKGATCLLTSFAHHSNDILLASVLGEWREQAKFVHREEKAQGILQEKAHLVGDFINRNRKAAMSQGEIVAHLEAETKIIFAFMTWKTATKVERMRRLGRDKNEKRKKELVGVKSMFSDFANKLEGNLAKGTPRVEDLKPHRKQLQAAAVSSGSTLPAPP